MVDVLPADVGYLFRDDPGFAKKRMRNSFRDSIDNVLPERITEKRKYIYILKEYCTEAGREDETSHHQSGLSNRFTLSPDW